MKILEMAFKGEDLKVKRFNLKYVNESVSATDVQMAMDKIASLHLFQREGHDLYATPVKADMVNTTTEELFHSATPNTPNA